MSDNGTSSMSAAMVDWSEIVTLLGVVKGRLVIQVSVLVISTVRVLCIVASVMAVNILVVGFMIVVGSSLFSSLVMLFGKMGIVVAVLLSVIVVVMIDIFHIMVVLRFIVRPL